MRRRINLRESGAQALYWGQIALREKLGLSDAEVRLKTIAIEIHRDLNLTFEYNHTYSVSVSYTVHKKFNREYCRLANISIQTNVTHRSEYINLQMLPGYQDWISGIEGKTETQSAA